MPELKPSIDSRITGDEAGEDVELGKRPWPRNENVGVTGDGKLEEVVACEH